MSPRRKDETAVVAAYMAQIGKRGGASTSPSKQAAARKNGRKGGRPRKAKPEAKT